MLVAFLLRSLAMVTFIRCMCHHSWYFTQLRTRHQQDIFFVSFVCTYQLNGNISCIQYTVWEVVFGKENLKVESLLDD